MDEERLHAFRDPNGVRPLQIGRLPGGRLGGRLRDRGARHRRRVYVRDVAPGEVVTIDERAAQPAASRRRPDLLPVRVGLPRPPRPPPGRRQRAVRAPRDGPPARPRGPGRRRHRDPGAGGRPRRRRRVRRRGGPAVRRRAGQEPLRRPHLHPADPVAAPARHQAEALAGPRDRRGRAAGRGRRLDRARQHLPAAGRDAARAPAPPRCTCASPRRRSRTPATTASTWPPAPS
jgi:hypothetical protein